MRKIACLISLMFLIIGCKPDNDLTFHLTGEVTDISFNQALNSGEVKVYTVPPESTTGKLVETGSISSSGTYSVEIDRGLYNSIIIEIDNDDYFEESREVLFEELKPNEENKFDFSVTAKAWIKFVIKNQNNPSESDELKFLKSYGKESCEQCCPNGFTFYDGITDFEKVCPNDGEDGFAYKYWVNGNEIFQEDSIKTPAFDTVVVNIFY